MTSQPDEHEYQCPGEPSRISRAVHLARLADGYSACGHCPHRDDVVGLSKRSRQRIPAVRDPRGLADYLYAEGVLGNLHEGFDSLLAGRFAAGFGILLREALGATDRYPAIAVASDGRSITQQHFTEVVEKLRWVGCNVIELGSVPCPALSWAIGELDADGGLYVGNPVGDPHKAGLRFYRADGVPISEVSSLGAISALVDSAPSRPVRVSGEASRADALGLYESRFADSFHGLRPLRFLIHTTCRPTGVCLTRLLQATACKMELRESETAVRAQPLPDPVGHFAAAIEEDGQRCHLWDERGGPVPFERLFLLLFGVVCGSEPSNHVVVVEEELPEAFLSVLRRSGASVRHCGPLPSDMHRAMARSGATLGADRGERIWYGESGERVIADALGSLTLLLGKLSDGDRPLSEVLDAATAGH